ncbi:hypothetical protein Tco_1321059 [Tanacetum coccineum]
MSSLKEDTHSIKNMMIEMYEAFKGQPSSSSSVTPTLDLTHFPANVEGENATTTTTEETPSHIDGETRDATMAIPISSIQPTFDQPITLVIYHPESSQATLRIDKGKGIATESDKDPSKRLVPASTIIRPDPNEPVRVEFMINGKIVYLTEQEIQKPEVIKVIREEAKKFGIDPKEAISTKAGETFRKAQDAEHEVLKREHSKKVK